MRIRPATQADSARLARIGAATFSEAYLEHFRADFTLESLARYLELTFSNAKLATELAEAHARFFLAETPDGEPVGYLKLGQPEAPPCVPGRLKLCLERVYVLKAAQRAGLGRKFLSVCLDHARELGFEVVWLCCWDGNTEALGFYERLGFKRVGTSPFQVTGSKFSDTDVILALTV